MRVRARWGILFGLAACDDADCDGFDAAEDCDDHDRRENPHADEVCGNGVDDNCDASSAPCGFDPAVSDWARVTVGSFGPYGLPNDGSPGAVWVTSEATTTAGALVGYALGAGREAPDAVWTLDGDPLDELGAALAVGEPGWLAGAPGRGAAGHGGVDRLDDAGRVRGTIAGTEPFARLGASVGTIDGAIAAGAPYASRGAPYAGAVYVFDHVDGAREDTTADATLLGDVPGGRLGAALVGADDVGDGRDRLFVAGADADGYGRLYRLDDPRGTVTVADTDLVDGATTAKELWRVCAADLDGDGREEVVFQSGLNGCIADLDGDGRGGFVFGEAYQEGGPAVRLGPWTVSVSSAAAADLDGDGFPDLWLAGDQLEVIFGGPGLRRQ